MTEFPGFPSNDFDFHFEEAGGALAGMLLRSRDGEVVPGVLPHAETLLVAGTGWSIRVLPFVAARSKNRAVLLGGSTEELLLDVAPPPAANSRIDVVYSLPADVGAGDPVQAAAVARGLPGAVPAKPSIPDGAIELGTLRVMAGNTSAAAASLTETFKFAAVAGGLLYARTRADLNQIDVVDGVRAFVLADGSTPERVRGAWVGNTTAAYIAPFKAFGAGMPAVVVEVADGMVSVVGAATNTKPADLVGTTRRVFARLPDAYAPKKDIVLRMQGSGVSGWALEVLTNGEMTACRYAPETPAVNQWLPFAVSWPLKRR